MSDRDGVAGPAEPLLTRATVTALATAVLGALVAWGLPLTAGQQVAVLAVVGAAAPVVLGWWARRHVLPAKRSAR